MNPVQEAAPNCSGGKSGFPLGVFLEKPLSADGEDGGDEQCPFSIWPGIRNTRDPRHVFSRPARRSRKKATCTYTPQRQHMQRGRNFHLPSVLSVGCSSAKECQKDGHVARSIVSSVTAVEVYSVVSRRRSSTQVSHWILRWVRRLSFLSEGSLRDRTDFLEEFDGMTMTRAGSGGNVYKLGLVAEVIECLCRE